MGSVSEFIADYPGPEGGAPLPSEVLKLLAPTKPQQPAQRLNVLPMGNTGAGAIEKRALAYFAAVGPHEQGTLRSTAFTVAAMLRRNLEIADVQAWPLFQRFNESYLTPPLDERELRECFDDGLKHGTDPIGCALVETPRIRSIWHVVADVADRNRGVGRFNSDVFAEVLA